MGDRNLRPKKSSEGFLTRLKRFASDNSGVGAVEFALVVPLLLTLYITAFEITVGFSVAQRVTRSASTIADLVTRENPTLTRSTLAGSVNVAGSIFAPYEPNDTLTIKITGVAMNAAGNPTVAWSWGNKQKIPYSFGTPVDVPVGMRAADSFLIRAEVSVQHQLLMFLTSAAPYISRPTISREFFYRPRMDSTMTCSDCAS